VPILAMSQLSRAVEQRHDKRPILSDLRESARSSRTPTSSCSSTATSTTTRRPDQQGLAEIILAKHRNGPTGTERLSFLKRYAKFADLAA
jgi:replicative DNA helicase